MFQTSFTLPVKQALTITSVEPLVKRFLLNVNLTYCYWTGKRNSGMFQTLCNKNSWEILGPISGNVKSDTWPICPFKISQTNHGRFWVEGSVKHGWFSDSRAYFILHICKLKEVREEILSLVFLLKFGTSIFLLHNVRKHVKEINFCRNSMTFLPSISAPTPVLLVYTCHSWKHDLQTYKSFVYALKRQILLILQLGRLKTFQKDCAIWCYVFLEISSASTPTTNWKRQCRSHAL